MTVHEPPSTAAVDEPDDRPVPPDADALLGLLGDEYTVRILSAMGEESLPARELAERADVSRQTVYRRLNRLASAGIVETDMAVHEDGHHRQEFRIVVDEFEIALDGDSLVATLENGDAAPADQRAHPTSSARR